MTEGALPRGTVFNMDPIREDLRELKRDLREDMKGVREAVESLAGKFTEHTLEDADREAKVATELGKMRTKLDTLDGEVGERSRFIRNWVFGLIAVAIAATVGFVVRSAIDVQVGRPASPAPQASQPAPARSP
jgi:hypothetical protein